jgi:hypothetical protein
LGILAKKFEAYKTAQFCYHKLANLQYPVDWTEKIDKEIMDIRNKPCLDGEQLIPECPYCGHNKGLINTNGDFCSYCSAPFIRCGLSFEILPLVEFRQDKHITADTAIDLIKQGTVEKMKNSASAGTPAPNMEKSMTIKTQVNYSKLVNLCLALSFVAIVMFAIGYLKHSDRLTFLALGMMASALLFHIGLNPITEEEEDENGEYL